MVKETYVERIAIGQCVGNLVRVAALLLLRVGGEEAGLLFDLAHDLELGGRAEIEAFLADECAQVAGHVAAGNVDAHYTVWHGESLENRYSVRYTVARVEDHAGHTARCVPVFRGKICESIG